MKPFHALPFLLVIAGLLAGCQSALPVAAIQAASPTPSLPATPTPPAELPTQPVIPLALTGLPAHTSTPAPSPTPQGCSQAKGQVQQLQVNFEFFSKPVQFQLYLPPCYDPSSPVRYPVLYMLHGQNSTDEQWIRMGLVDAADRLIASKEIPPFIIVMPYEEYGLQDPAESSFGLILTDGLLPWVDEHYNTCIDRQCRAIGGVSRGAAWAVRLGFTDWQQFGAIGAHSLAYFWGDNAMLRQWTRQIPVGDLPRVYMDIGNADRYLQSATEFEGLLTRFEVPHTWLINQGEHEESYWEQHVDEYLRWYAQPWSNQG